MPESHRLPLGSVDEAAGRDSQIDALLEDGLDRYFNGRYEDAIHLWTRVLFLDRTHARARAYIDRARTALNEAQRRSDEMLQASRDLIDQGQADAARQLLMEAVAAGGDEPQAAALRARIERFERARALAGDARLAPHAPAESVPGWSWRRTSPMLIAGLLAAVVVVAAAVIAMVSLTGGAPAPAAPPVLVGVRLPVLSSAEVAVVRARTLMARGRLSEAMAWLERVPSESPERAAADRLRVEIQQLLLASVSTSSGDPRGEARRR
jgi:thioredoxin-like negative regulator of GroEL